MEIIPLLSKISIAGGLFFFLSSALGLLRFPDFFTRLHAGGLGDTLGQGLILLGLILHQGFDLISAKLFLIFLFLCLTTPTSTHTLMRAALREGLKPWTTDGVEKSEDDGERKP